MRQFLNSLYVTTQGAWLAATAKSSMCALKKKASCGSPSRRYQALSASDRFRCSPFLMALCAEHGVKLAFLTGNGGVLARLERPVLDNVLLRRRQYRNADLAEQASSITTPSCLPNSPVAATSYGVAHAIAFQKARRRPHWNVPPQRMAHLCRTRACQ